MTEWLGQNGEDGIIAAYLAEHHPGLVGRVLDIGAHDGWSLSNTGRLLDRGWGGVLVEASPRPLAALLDRWGDRIDISVVGALLTPDVRPDGYLATLHDNGGDPGAPLGDFYSTSNLGNLRKWGEACRFRSLRLPWLSVDELLDSLPGPYHVVSIDVEGESVDILRALPLSALGTLALVVEHDDRVPEVADHVEAHGMRVVAVNAENVIAVR